MIKAVCAMDKLVSFVTTLRLALETLFSGTAVKFQ